MYSADLYVSTQNEGGSQVAAGFLRQTHAAGAFAFSPTQTQRGGRPGPFLGAVRQVLQGGGGGCRSGDGRGNSGGTQRACEGVGRGAGCGEGGERQGD